MQVDEIMSLLFCSDPSEATDRAKMYITLEPEHPAEDRDGAHTTYVSERINEYAKQAAAPTPDRQHPLEPMVIDPGAIPPNAIAINGLQQAVEEDVGSELRRQNEEARKQRSARESLRRAGKLSAAASKEAAAAAQKAVVEAGSKLGEKILGYQRWSMSLFNEALAVVAPGTTSHAVLVNIASSCAFEAMRLLG